MNATRMTVKQMFQKAKENGQLDLCKWIKQMRRAGLRVYHYKGRFWWEGPAVDVPNVQDALSNTKVPSQFDSMGRDYVVYPREALRN